MDSDDDAVAEALKAATDLSDVALLEMGMNGRSLVLEKYQWSQISKDLLDGYRWIVNGGTAPKCVYTG